MAAQLYFLSLSVSMAPPTNVYNRINTLLDTETNGTCLYKYKVSTMSYYVYKCTLPL